MVFKLPLGGSQAALSAMASTTMLPFLYQTSTLARLRCSTLPPVSQVTHSCRQQRALGQSHRLSKRYGKNLQHSSDPSPSSAEKKAQEVDGQPQNTEIRRPTDNIFSEIAADYKPKGESTKPKFTTGVHAEADRMDYAQYQAPEYDAADEDEEDIQFEPESRASRPSKSVEDLINPRTQGESTITISERFAFQRIFADLFERNQQLDPAFGVVEDDERYPSGPPLQQTSRKLGTILEGAVAPKKTFQTVEEKKAAVARYPPALRAAAARAFGLELTDDLTEDMEEPEPEPETNMSVYELDKVRGPERERVEALMRGAKSDFELWGVLEKEVFPLVTKLGLNVGALAPDAPQPKKAKKAKAKQVEVQKNEVVAAKSPVEGISALDFYGPLYPTYLLLALRVFDRSFAQSSALTLTILPKIKSLGVISHVLGGSTAFYNELLRIYCFRQDDLPMVDKLLKEMLEAGLEFDDATQSAVQDIIQYREAVTNETKGRPLRMLWQLPEWAPYDFRSWLKLIKEKVETKRAESEAKGMLRR